LHIQQSEINLSAAATAAVDDDDDGDENLEVTFFPTEKIFAFLLCFV
jgi:hypothetical protein